MKIVEEKQRLKYQRRSWADQLLVFQHHENLKEMVHSGLH
jgi:hypothetical protein